MARRFVDLSLSIYHQAPTFTPDPKCGVLIHHTLATMGYNITQLVMSTHQGTHLDAALHFFDGGQTVDKIPLKKCAGEALVIDLSHKKAKQEIRISDLKPRAGKIKKGTKLLIRTDWDKVFPRPEYFSDQPMITPELARWLARKQIDLLGLETPGVHPVEYAAVHKALLAKEIVVVEGLSNLRKLKKKEVFFIALPLKIKGREGSPVRAIAIEE